MEEISGILGGIFSALSTANPVSLVINIVVSTIVGGLVFLLIAKIFAKAFSESVAASRAFLAVLVINIINLPFIMGFLSTLILAIPYASYLLMVLPLLIWIGLSKLAFSEMATSHAVLVGLVGWILSIFVIPYLTAIVMGLVPVV